MLEIVSHGAATEPASTDDPTAAGHNGGPPLEDEHTPTGPREIGRVRQTVVSSADHDYVVLRHEIC